MPQAYGRDLYKGAPLQNVHGVFFVSLLKNVYDLGGFLFFKKNLLILYFQPWDSIAVSSAFLPRIIATQPLQKGTGFQQLIQASSWLWRPFTLLCPHYCVVLDAPLNKEGIKENQWSWMQYCKKVKLLTESLWWNGHSWNTRLRPFPHAEGTLDFLWSQFISTEIGLGIILPCICPLCVFLQRWNQFIFFHIWLK